jgi:hypothetical protein
LHSGIWGELGELNTALSSDLVSKELHHTIKLLESAMFPQKKHASMVKSDAKQQESVVFLKCHRTIIRWVVIIAMNSRVACCLIRKLSWCLQAQLLMQGLSGKTATF